MLPEKFDLDGDGKKAKWRDNFVQKLKELVDKQQSKQLRCNELRHLSYKDAEEELARRSQTGEAQDFFFDPSLPLTRRKVAKSTAFKTRASSEKEKHAKAAAKPEPQNPFMAMQAEMARKATARAKRNAPKAEHANSMRGGTFEEPIFAKLRVQQKKMLTQTVIK
jgi:hypothetical protein